MQKGSRAAARAEKREALAHKRAEAKAAREAAERDGLSLKPPADKFDAKYDSLTLLIIVVVSLVQSLALNGFYVPHSFLSGGITGVSMLLSYLAKIPTWATIIALNIPVTIIGFKYLSAKLSLMSLFATVVFAAAFSLTEGVDFGVKNPIVSAIAGAAIIGVTSAPVVRRDATMGGIDVIAAFLSKRYSIQMGAVSIAFNLVIMSLLAVFRGLELALLSMIAMFICNVAFDFALKGLNRTVTVFIISDEWDEIAPMLMNRMHRGVTYINAEGAYTGKPKKLVYCIVRTMQLAPIKRIVKEIDPLAMFSIIETKEAFGRGFGSLN